MKRSLETEQKSIYRMLSSVVLEMIFLYIISNINQLILNNFSSEAIAATTAVGTFVSLMMNLYSVFYVGQGILLAVLWGRKDYKEGGKVWSVCLWDVLILSIVIGFIGVFGSTAFVKLQQVPVELQKMAGGYLTIILGLSVFQALSLTMVNAYRAIGKMKTVMIGNTLINGSCVLMNFLILVLVLKQQQTIYHYAMAGVLSQLFGAAFYLWNTRFVSEIQICLRWKRLGSDVKRVSRKILGVGFLGGMEGILYLISQTIVISMMGSLGTQALMVKGYTGNIINYLTLPASTVPLVAATLIGMAVGERNIQKANFYLKKCMKLSLISTLILCAAAWLFGEKFMMLYVVDGSLLKECMKIIWFDFLVEITRCIAALMIVALKAMGDVKGPLLMVIVGSILNIGISWLCGIYLGMGLMGIWYGYLADLVIRSSISVGIWHHHTKNQSFPFCK